MNKFDGHNIAYASVWSNTLGLDQITEVLGLPPDRGWTIGDRFERGSRDLYRKESAWDIAPIVAAESSIEDQLDSLYSRVEASFRRIDPQSTDLSCKLQIVQTLTVKQLQSRGLSIDNKWVTLLAEAGGRVDIDQYVVSIRDWRRFLRLDKSKGMTGGGRKSLE
jgi:hypothetical protein